MTLLDNQKFLEDSAKIAIWAVTELMIGIFAGSAPALRPLLRYVPFLSTHGTHDSSQGRGTVRSNGKNQSHVVVETDNFKNGAMVEAKRNQNGHATEDGDSEEYIPQERDASRKMSIRKHVSVKVESSCGAED